MKRNAVILCCTAALLATVASHAAGQAPLTEGAVTRELVTDVLRPVLEALQERPGVAGVAIRQMPGAPAGTTLHEAVGNFLHERGYEVFTLAPQATPPEGALVLDLEVRIAGFDYPEARGGFLGLGAGRVLRRGALGVSGRLEDSSDGRWLWRGSPQAHHEDWIQQKQQTALASDRPPWMAARPLSTGRPRSGWWERGVVAGLLAGVIVLYLDGAQ